MIACRAGHLDVVEFLLARQAQVDALGRGPVGSGVE